MNAASVAVVGAGLAGLACARRLRAAGVHARVFEAQRAPGGRLATRRFAAAGFDHGAQYLTASGAAFRGLLEEASLAGAAGRWRPRWPDGGRDRELWVGLPAMGALPRFLARELDVEYGARIQRIARGGRGWSLLDERGFAHDGFTAVALALPAPVAAALAGPLAPAPAARARAVTMAPSVALLAAFESPLAGVPDAGFPGDGMLAWYARDSSKPGRGGGEAFVLHATAGWSRSVAGQPAHVVQRALLDRFSEHLGRPLPGTLVADVHRWRHARVEAPLGEPFLLDAAASVGLCGDWCIAPRAEAAWDSGSALGAALAAAREVTASGKIRGSR